MNPEQLKNFLRNHNIRPNKTYGQNFLLNDVILTDMVDSVPIKKGDAVLEVGPGIGNLTRLLLARSEFVLAVEKDRSFLPILRSLKKDHKNFRFEFADILEFDFQAALSTWPRTPLDHGQGGSLASRPYHVVANIPYYITGKIVRLFVQAKHRPETITMLLQKEVAHNIVAKPGQLNLLAISVQIYGDPKILLNVPARDFYPAPKVDSAVVQIQMSKRPRYEVGDEKVFFRMLRACFSGKRKQIHNTLRNNLKLDKDFVEQALKHADVALEARPQELSIEQWIKLAREINLT